MADTKKKKNTEDLDNMDMDFGDMGDFDAEMSFDDEDSIDNENREPSRTKVVTQLGKAAGEGFFEDLVTKSAKNVLPDSYESGYYEAMDLANFGKEVVDKNKDKLKKSTYRLGKEVAKALPFKVKMLDDFIENASSDFEQIKQQSEEQMRDASISSDLTSIFDKQIEVQKAIAAQSSAEADVEKRTRIIQGKMSQDVLASIDRNTSRHTEFTLQIAKEFYRKSLELQYKSYFVQADMLRVMRDHYKGFSLQFTNIEKNTSLPEFVKLKKTEHLQEMMRDNATQQIYDTMFTNSKFMQGLKKKMTRYVDDKISTVTDAMDSATDMLGNLNSASEMGGGSGAGMMMEAGAGMAGGQIGEYAADKIPQGFRDKIKNNKLIQTGGNYLSMLVNNPATLFKTLQQSTRAKATEFETDDTVSGKLGGMITGGLANLLDASAPESIDKDLKKTSYLSHGEPAIFDKKVHRSITEVIPLYLAKILKQNTDLTSMYQLTHVGKLGKFTPAEELLYDFERRKLDGEKSIIANIQSSVFGDRSRKNKSADTGKDIIRQSKARISSDKTVAKSDKGKEISAILGSKRSEEMLAKYIEQAREIYGDKLTFEHLTSGDDEKLKKAAEKIEGLDKVLKAIKDANLEKETTQAINSKMTDSVRTYPVEAVKQLLVGVSRLAKSDPPNVIADDTAAILAECFTRYTFDTSQPITSAGVVSRSALRIPIKFDKNQKLLDAIAILITDLKKIDLGGDWVAMTSRDSLFAIMNSDLQRTMDSPPALFQTLQDLMPTVVTQRKISLENAAEGLIGDFSGTEYVDISQLRGLGKVSKADMVAMRRKSNLESVIDKFVGNAKGLFKDAAKSIRETGGDPFKLAELAINTAQNATTAAGEALKNTSKRLNDKTAEIAKELGEVGDKVVVGGLNKTITKLSEYSLELDKRVAGLKQDLEERQRIFNEATALITESTNKVSFAKQSERFRSVQIRIVEANIKALEKTKAETQVLITQLQTIQANSSGSDVTDVMSRVKASIQSNVERVSAIVKEYEEKIKTEDKAAASA